MSWKKYVKPVNSVLPTRDYGSGSGHTYTSKFSSWLPEIYQGPPDRLQRYSVYETMGYDHQINAALDTIADFCTENDEKTNLPFNVKYHEETTEVEIELIERSLKQWCILNDFNKRLWKTFKLTLKYGDQFFVRDPESYKLYWLDPNKVTKIIVNESEGKKIEAYYVKDMDLNIKDMVATNSQSQSANTYGTTSLVFSPPLNGTISGNASNYVSGSGSGNSEDELPLDAEHVLHMTMTDGMSSSWPFGESILEYIYKVYKQKELLEDSILIYRVHRAPERRIFYIDVGMMPPNKSQQYLERVRYDVQQKRIPSRTGGGANIADSTYNPMSALEDYFFAVTSDGRGSKVETLPGGDNLGDIDDLRFWNNQMLRALGVPSSYLPTGPEDGSASYNDGRVGTAFIQEFRFSKVCERFQKQIISPLDEEFKLFLKYKGISVDNAMFSLQFTKPQSFSEYRQMELDAAHINTFGAVVDTPFMSRRFAAKRYLGWTEEEVLENERMWREEKGMTFTGDTQENLSISTGLNDLGISASGVENMSPEGGFEEVDGSEFDDDLDNSQDDINNFGEP